MAVNRSRVLGPVEACALCSAAAGTGRWVMFAPLMKYAITRNSCDTKGATVKNCPTAVQ